MCLSDLQEYVYPDARDRQYLLFFHKGVKRTRFDVEKYNKLKDDIAEVQSLGGSFWDVKRGGFAFSRLRHLALQQL